MPERSEADADRRRTPRFACGGQVEISYLPSNGIFLPGKMRDVSLGGCSFDSALPINCGTRAEIVVHINAGSFRAVGEFKALRDPSRAGMEFVLLSAAGREMLAELVAHLARLQKLMLQLRSAREMDADALQKGLEQERSRVAILYEAFPFRRVIPAFQAKETILDLQGPDEDDKAVEKGTKSLVIPVDLFG